MTTMSNKNPPDKNSNQLQHKTSNKESSSDNNLPTTSNAIGTPDTREPANGLEDGNHFPEGHNDPDLPSSLTHITPHSRYDAPLL